MSVIVGIFPANLFNPMVNADMLPVIVIAIFFGADILAAGEKGQKIVELVNFTPCGVFCLMADVVAAKRPGRRRLSGAGHVPRNTAHYFYYRLQPFINVLMLHMPRETAKRPVQSYTYPI